MAYCIWKSYKLNGNVLKIFEAIKDRQFCFFLDSSLSNDRLGRYSFLGFDPFCIVKGNGPGALEELSALLARHAIKGNGHLAPFLGGAVGFLSYDWEAFFGLYDTVIAIDHDRNNLYIYSSRKENLKKIINLLAGIDFRKKTVSRRKDHQVELASNFSHPDYIQAVKKAKGYIKAGDIYQVNLSQRFSALAHLNAFEIYQRLRNISPSFFSAYFDTGDAQVISSSPERFLSLRNNIVHTRPMKGTRPRSFNRLKDISNKRDLLKSAKDKAELLMIVDLMRNDLGRVCKYGTVKVSSLRNIETYQTVFQTTADVTGRLHPDKDRIALIKACFPGGSITGCPKIRAMEIIAELEHGPRSIYTGSMGYLSFCGNMDLNILIRTMHRVGERVHFGVGGGIVADSHPESEYAETLVKAKAMMQALSYDQ